MFERGKSYETLARSGTQQYSDQYVVLNTNLVIAGGYRGVRRSLRSASHRPAHNRARSRPLREDSSAVNSPGGSSVAPSGDS